MAGRFVQIKTQRARHRPLRVLHHVGRDIDFNPNAGLSLLRLIRHGCFVKYIIGFLFLYFRACC